MSDVSATDDLDRVIGKIQKLFARAGRGGHGVVSEEEADAAMRIAQELMAKHNLDVAAVEAAAARRGDVTGPVERVREESSSRTARAWQRELAKYVAEAHFAYHLVRIDREWDEEKYKYKKRATHVFVGRRGNVTTAQLMFNYLIDAIDGLAPKTTPEDDARAWVGRVGWGTHRSVEYRVRVVEAVNGGVAFQRIDDNGHGEAGEVYRTIGEAAKRCLGFATNGYQFFHLGEASTSESWKAGCAERLCERLAQRRKDLVEQHDARVRQADEDARRAREEAARADAARAARVLGADAGAAAAAAGARAVVEVGDLAATARPPREAEGGDREVVRSVEDDEAWSPPTAVDAVPTTTALVLASAYDASEREANYELAHGMEPGTLARHRREQEERDARWEAGRAARQAAAATEEREAPVREETEKERQRRFKRESEERARSRRRWAREDARDARKVEREYEKVDHDAFRAGAGAADKIGLDPQVRAANETRRLKS